MSNYATYAEGDTYFDAQLRAEAWTDATDGDKTKALTEATRIIDRLNYKGAKYDEDQDNEFPRGEDTTVPTDIQYACMEIAYALLDGVEPENELHSLRLSGVTYSNAKAFHQDNSALDYIIAGIPSMVAWNYLLPYIRDPNKIRIERVS